MPAIMTHDFFGQDAYDAAAELVSLFTPDELNAFLLGNQGPDPLFYLMLTPPLEEFRKLGEDMHHMAPTQLFLALRKATDELSEEKRSVGRAYLAGFTCHYLLDRAMHPFVYYWERGLCQAGIDELDMSDSGMVHAEVERDFDEMVLFTKRQETIATYRPYEQVLRGRDEMLAIVGDLYFSSVAGPVVDGEPTANKVFPLAVYCFRVAQRMFWSPTGTKRDSLAKVEGPLLKNRYSLVRAMSHRPRAEATSDFDNREHARWRNPFTGATSNESFWDIYQRALDEVGPTLSVVLGDGFNEEAAFAMTGGLDFCGEPVE